jgi:hypothetical protein
MRTSFRILILDKNKIKVSEKLDIDNKNLTRAIKYIHKSQYIEASKWLFLANDSKEKYLLLSLISFALKQEDQALNYFENAKDFTYLYKEHFDVYIQKPGEPVEYAEDFMRSLFLAS